MGLFNKRSKKGAETSAKKPSEMNDTELMDEYDRLLKTMGQQTKELAVIKAVEAYNAENYDEARELLLKVDPQDRLADQGKLEYYLSICYAQAFKNTRDASFRDLGIECMQKAAAVGNEASKEVLEKLVQMGVVPENQGPSPSTSAQQESSQQESAQQDPAQTNARNIPLADDQDPDEFPEDAIVTLTDPNGQPAEFAILGEVEYKRESYVVLFPTKDDGSGEVVIVQVKDDPHNPELEQYVPASDKLVPKLFQIFQEKYKDVYHFDV